MKNHPSPPSLVCSHGLESFFSQEYPGVVYLDLEGNRSGDQGTLYLAALLSDVSCSIATLVSFGGVTSLIH